MQIFKPSQTLLERVDFRVQAFTLFHLPSFDYRGNREASELLVSSTSCVGNLARTIYGEQRFNRQHCQQVSINLFSEQIHNCSEHGNKCDSNKSVSVGLWFGGKGILFAYRDQGTFFSELKTKQALESRSRIPSSRVGAGGYGTQLLYEAADELVVVTQENTLYVVHLL